jgi:hypothetical protein
VKRLLAIFTGKHQPDRGALSAYLDGQLAADRAAALEAHVASCEACAGTLDGMRQVRAMLRAMPEAEPPRSFRLRPSDIAAPARPRAIAAPPPSLMRAMPMLAAAAVIVFAITLGLDLTAGSNSDNDRSAGLSATTERTAAYAEDSAGAAAAARNQDGGQNGPPAADEAPGGGADSAAPEPNVPAASRQMTAEAGPDVAAAAATDDDDGNNLTLRIVEVAAAAVAIVAGGLALRTWRKKSEGVA